MKKLLLTGFALFSVAALAQAPAWTVKNSNFPGNGAYPRNIEIVSPTVAWAYAADGSGGGANLQQYSRTSDAGETWTGGLINLGNTALQISDLAAGDANTAWVAVNGANQGIWKTSNGGTTWAKQSTAAFALGTSFPNIVYFWDVNNGVTMGDPDSSGKFEIYTTSNGGTTWARIPGGNQPTVSNEFGYTTIRDVAGNTIWFGTDLGRVFKSNDRGLTWTAAQTPIIDFGGVTVAGASGTIEVKDANTAWVMDQDGLIYSTTDAGATWEVVNVDSGTVYVSDLEYVPGTANTLISSGASTLGRGSSISFDGGANWTDITPAAGDGDGIPSLAAYSTDFILGGGFRDATVGGGMNKLSQLLATVSPDLAKNKVTVYPNPTKGEVHIASKSNVKSVQVLDMNGRAVKSFNNTKDFDLSNLQAGVYILSVTLEDGQKTATKLVKK